MTAPRSPLLLAAAALALVTAGCGSESGSAPPAGHGAETLKEAAWTEPGRYSFRLLSEGGERNGLGEYRITVEDGKVVKAVGLDEQARRTVTAGLQSVPTLGDLLKEFRQARQDRADVARAEFAADGHPTEIHLDWRKDSLDDEADYQITEYRVHRV
ncbi:DUF6174 domain-containing protein [Streptomyces sp. NPDC001970]